MRITPGMLFQDSLVGRKTQRIKEHWLDRQSITSKVITQAPSRCEYKRVVKARAVVRVDRVGAAGCSRDLGGTRGRRTGEFINLEEEGMKALLIWKLAENSG
jgi:hypothetical protein